MVEWDEDEEDFLDEEEEEEEEEEEAWPDREEAEREEGWEAEARHIQWLLDGEIEDALIAEAMERDLQREQSRLESWGDDDDDDGA